MKYLKETLLIVASTILSGCSLGIDHIGEAKQFNPDGTMIDEYSINDYGYGVHVRAEYSEHQFIRSSASGFRGCTNVLNTVALNHAKETGKRIKIISWREMKENGYIDHGRDPITAVMNVNCEYYFDYRN
ncbi:hypothetical protein F2P58_21015 [Vibrio fortis]|uniref:Lipoprotein n=1 Tax=Vibrio fortis TaxID=212667 RepID=A0A5N3QY63_9VIBR|nr:hypothetical protein [Vibrio fortis]KAB0287107.1 hypothetical protein F2P58_21015 [Vibrio fortis]